MSQGVDSTRFNAGENSAPKVLPYKRCRGLFYDFYLGWLAGGRYQFTLSKSLSFAFWPAKVMRGLCRLWTSPMDIAHLPQHVFQPLGLYRTLWEEK